MIERFENFMPTFGKNCYIHNSSIIIGDVFVGDDVSIWPLVSIRGDVASVKIGDNTNIQEGTIIHVTGETKKLENNFPVYIGSNVTIGHGVMLHGCAIEDACLIGMRSIVLDGAVVSKHSFLGAGSLLPPKKVIPEGELWLGSPAKFVRKLSDTEIEDIYYSAKSYCELKDRYLKSIIKC